MKNETDGGKKGLDDGVYELPIGKKRKQMLLVSEGAAWMPVSMMHPIIWMTAGSPLKMVDGHIFMRAKDFAEAVPNYADAVQDFADRHGITT